MDTKSAGGGVLAGEGSHGFPSPARHLKLLIELTAERQLAGMVDAARSNAHHGGRLWAYCHALLILAGETPTDQRIDELVEDAVREAEADGDA